MYQSDCLSQTVQIEQGNNSDAQPGIYLYAYFRNRDYFQNIFAEICIRKPEKTDKKLIVNSGMLILLPIISAQCLTLAIQRTTYHY